MRIESKELDPAKRIKNFNEVCIGLTEDEAIEEAHKIDASKVVLYLLTSRGLSEI